MRQSLREDIWEIARRVELEFFRIERESRWRAACINGLIAGTSVGVIAWLVMTLEQGVMKFEEGNLILFACLGSSSAAIVFAPVARTNSLRSIVLAYLIAAAWCAVLIPLRESQYLSLPMQCFVAVTLSITLMRMLDAMHPAAVGSVLAFVIYRRNIESLLLLLLAIIGLLMIVKVLAYIYREELTFRDFPREFRRQYYGAEMLLHMDSDRPVRDVDPGHPVVVHAHGVPGESADAASPESPRDPSEPAG